MSPAGFCMLAFIPPLLPSRAPEAPAGPDWIHEIKHDGFRTLITIGAGEARAFTRNGSDWTARYAPVVKTARRLPCRSATIDGEIVVQDPDGFWLRPELRVKVSHLRNGNGLPHASVRAIV